MSPRHIDVDVRREDGYWVGVAAGIRGGTAEAKQLAKLEGEVRDLLAGLLDVDEDDLRLELHLDSALSPAADETLRAFLGSRDDLAQAQRTYTHDQADAVRALAHDDLSLRDTAYLTGLTYQRIQQLTKV